MAAIARPVTLDARKQAATDGIAADVRRAGTGLGDAAGEVRARRAEAVRTLKENQPGPILIAISSGGERLCTRR